MTHSKEPSDGEAAELTREEQRFVARVADVYHTPPLSPSRRVAFQTQLDARIARRGGARLFPALAGALGAAALTWLVLVGLGSPTDKLEGEPPTARAATAEEAILALSADEEIEDESLPEEYVAIASLFLDS
jgi:hypothetical protein